MGYLDELGGHSLYTIEIDIPTSSSSSLLSTENEEIKHKSEEEEEEEEEGRKETKRKQRQKKKSDRGHREGIQKAWIELLLLSQTTTVLHSYGSSFGEEAAQFRGGITDIRIRYDGNVVGIAS